MIEETKQYKIFYFEQKTPIKTGINDFYVEIPLELKSLFISASLKEKFLEKFKKVPTKTELDNFLLENINIK